MTTLPIFGLLALDLVVFVVVSFVFDRSSVERNALPLSLLFFCSGMPALIYQIVWQRVLFAIYGVNAESVAIIVSAFMLGLGVGALVGGRLSASFPQHGIVLFAVAELGTAAFGLLSLRIFHWVAIFSAGTSLPHIVIFSLALLLVPTILMGATLPLLVEHLIRVSGRVGTSVATLYFVNTLGSATACTLCATFLLRDFGQSGSISMAAILNTIVGATAFLYARSRQFRTAEAPVVTAGTGNTPRLLSIAAAMLIAGFSGFIALGLEIAWFRVFSLAASDRAPAFALLLSAYLAGIAGGSFVSEKFSGSKSSSSILSLIGMLMLAAGALSAYLPPLVAAAMAKGIPFLWTAPAFFLTAALIGSVFPLTCELAVSADDSAGRRVSLLYVSNILGSAVGSLGIGFVLMNYFGLRQVSLLLAAIAVISGATVLFLHQGKVRMPPLWATPIVIAAVIAVSVGAESYSLLFERLIFATRSEAREPFAHVLENRNGVIAVTRAGAIFGGGVYDGNFNIDPTDDVNYIVRAYSVASFVPNPKKVFVLGLASGSWAQVIVHDPQVESMDIVEINPGHLQLVSQYAEVRSLLHNPKVHIYTDDARRWLTAHPEKRYDAIIANGTYYWRDHSSHLLSVEFMQLIRAHLNTGGVYFYNTTESDDAIATGLSVFPYGLRVLNFLAVSDSPIVVDKDRWLAILCQYKIDGKLVFDPANPKSKKTLAAYMAFADSAKESPRFLGMEYADSLDARLGRRFVFTEDNMGWEWRSSNVEIPWH
jgi:predicted membrane-bound spermidine synthase